MERLTRRELLALIETIAVSTAAAGLVGACKKRGDEPPPEIRPEPAPTLRPPSLAPEAYRALEAATARILPGAADFAGAREARVMGFITRQLAVAPFVRLAPGLVALAGALDQQATRRGKIAFAELDVAAQDAVLDELARGAWPGVAIPQRELFRVLHTLTLEGFLADPAHGGNHDGAGWKAIDFPEPPLRTPGGGHAHGH